MTNQKISANTTQQQSTTVDDQQIAIPSIIQQIPESSKDSSNNAQKIEEDQQQPILSRSTSSGTARRKSNQNKIRQTRAKNADSHIPENISDRAYRNNNDNSTLSMTETAGLKMVLERMQRCFAERTYAHDTEILELSLRHIFMSADILYSTLLPELTTVANRVTTNVEVPLSEQDIHAHYCIWSLLQEIEAVLERLEPLCQLLIGAVTGVLEALDRSCSIYETLHIKRRLQQEGEDDENTEILAAIEVSHIPENTYYQWMQAVRLLTGRLQSWHTSNKMRISFAKQFMDITLAAPTLTQIDTTIDVLLENIQVIFGTLLPEFHTIAKGDDETTATLLVDVVQRTDQLLIHMEMLLEPLHTLIHQSGVEVTL